MSSHPRVGVVMAIYGGVDARHLTDALTSLERQTLRPDEVVVVADGPLTPSLERVLAHVGSGPLEMSVVRLARRSGAGPAREAGLRAASSDFLAIADADDVSMPRRLAAQRSALCEGGLDLVGAAMVEFGTAVPRPQVRTAPAGDGAIRRRARFNNPFNHPTVMFRASLAREVGGYRDVPFLEDYDFVVRMLASGARARNDPEPLVRYRLDVETLKRRSSPGITRAELTLQRTLVETGLVSPLRLPLNLLLRTGYRLMPGWAKRVTNRLVLSRPGRVIP